MSASHCMLKARTSLQACSILRMLLSLLRRSQRLHQRQAAGPRNTDRLPRLPAFMTHGITHLVSLSLHAHAPSL